MSDGTLSLNGFVGIEVGQMGINEVLRLNSYQNDFVVKLSLLGPIDSGSGNHERGSVGST